MMRGTRSKGQIFSVPGLMAVDAEGDAHVEERLFGGGLPAFEFAWRQLGQLLGQRSGCWPRDPGASNISS